MFLSLFILNRQYKTSRAFWHCYGSLKPDEKYPINIHIIMLVFIILYKSKWKCVLRVRNLAVKKLYYIQLLISVFHMYFYPNPSIQKPYVMVKMLVAHFAITVIFAHQILVLVTSMRCNDFSALADWSPKLTMSCTPMHIHSVGYTYVLLLSVVQKLEQVHSQVFEEKKSSI